MPNSRGNVFRTIRGDAPSPRLDVLVIDGDEKACRRLVEPAAPLPFRVRRISKFGDIPSGLLSSSLRLVLIGEDMIENKNAMVFLEAFFQKGIAVFLGSANGSAPGAAALKGVNGVVGRPYDPDEVYWCMVQSLCGSGSVCAAEESMTQLKMAAEELQTSQRTCDDLEKQLAQSRLALNLLMERIEAEVREASNTLQERVRRDLLPVIVRIKQQPQTRVVALELEGLVMSALRAVENPESLEALIFSSLTPTEQRVCLLIRVGLSTEQIAAHLGLSAHTVQSHRKSIRRKLGLHRRCYSLRHSLAMKRRLS